jgi:TonB family protein
MNRRVLLTAACVVLLRLLSTAQDAQSRADAMLDKARQLSDIRSPNAPPFQLKATFSFIGTDLETVRGTYTEVWVSNSQWRREIVVKDLRRIEVAGATRIWLLDNTKDFPQQATQLPSLVSLFPPKSASFAFESIADHPEMNPPSDCALTRPDTRHLKAAFCFDKKSGALVVRIFPEVRLRNTVNNSCEYASFHKFGDFWFPNEMACYEDRHKKIEAVLDLSAALSPDPALFAPLPDAIELGRCSEKLQPPVVKSVPSPDRFASRDEGPPVSVRVSLIVDTKGKPENVKVVNSGGAHFDELAVGNVRGWRFKPATCNGEPMPFQINVDVDFRMRR